jgi:hypothetical protein
VDTGTAGAPIELGQFFFGKDPKKNNVLYEKTETGYLLTSRQGHGMDRVNKK